MSGPMSISAADEERVVGELARELDALAADSAIVLAAGFVDRIMAVVALEPLPQPARAFRAAVLAGRLRSAVAAVGDAGRVVLGGSAPARVRAQAFALVLVVAIASLAVAGGAAVGAIDLLNGNQAPVPGPTTPLPSDATPTTCPSLSSEPGVAPQASPPPSPTSEATETPEPSRTPGATEHPGTTLRPTTTDDHGDGSGEGGSGSGSDSGDGGHTPSPTVNETDAPASSGGDDG